jgi:tRNA A-37 threonylcarbamoyl transferase component Bud32
MLDIKESRSTRVRLRSDWSVSKKFRGSNARERFENEIRVLRFLESKLCPFVPRLIHADPNLLEIVITNCGTAIQRLSPKKLEEIFSSFESYGVRHEDPAIRNVTYRASDGSFCVIDFELASIIDESNAPAQLFHRIENQFDYLGQLLTASQPRIFGLPQKAALRQQD